MTATDVRLSVAVGELRGIAIDLARTRSLEASANLCTACIGARIERLVALLEKGLTDGDDGR